LARRAADFDESGGDGGAEGVDGSCGGFARVLFELGEERKIWPLIAPSITQE
jgi:hypothetical protein